MARRTEPALLLALLLAAGCVDQGELFGPDRGVEGEAAPRLALAAGSHTLYEGDRVLLRPDRVPAAGAKAELLVLDGSGAVVWRSDPVQVQHDEVAIEVRGLPATLYGAEGLSVTASLIDARGARTFASDDTAAATVLASAARREARFWAGRVTAEEVGAPQSVALDAARGRLFFASADRYSVGAVDLESGAVEPALLSVSSGPVALSVGAGRLGALTEGGIRLVLWDLASLASRGSRIMPPAKLHMVWAKTPPDSAGKQEWESRTFGVRPYAGGLALGCADPTCSVPMGYAPSAAFGPGAGPGVLRRLPLLGGELSPLVVPEFHYTHPVDTVPARVWTVVPDAAGGDSVAAYTDYGSRCLSLAIGAGVVATSARPGAPLYVAHDAPQEVCGGGTRLMRLDGADTATPRLSSMAQWNQHGENRIGRIHEIRVSPDAAWVLVRGDEWVYLLDAELRLRGRIPEEGPTAIAWVEGRAGAPRFGVAGPGGVSVYEAERMTRVGRMPVGPVRSGRMVLRRDADGVTLAAVPGGRPGIVLARTRDF